MTENPATGIDAERGYTITRVFDAPRELVWKAWTEPARFAQWFGLPGSTMQDVTMDVTPGGSWSGTMLIPDGADILWRGFYLEVVEPERLVVAFSDEDIIGDRYDTFTVTLTDLGGTTEQVLRQSGGHLTDEQYEQAKEGTGIFLDRMAELLGEMA